MLFNLRTTKVVNSRFFKRQNTVWRRRQTDSGSIFTTRETIDLSKLKVIKKASPAGKAMRESYRPGKLFLSLYKALDHLEDAEHTAWQLTTTVEEKLTPLLDESFETDTETLATLAMATLKAFDTTAYVKYASYQPELVSARSLSATLR